MEEVVNYKDRLTNEIRDAEVLASGKSPKPSKAHAEGFRDGLKHARDLFEYEQPPDRSHDYLRHQD